MTLLHSTPHVLYTQRLKLRSPTLQDAAIIAQLAHNPKIASMTSTIPYPYFPSMAIDWIERIKTQHLDGSNRVYLICHLQIEDPLNPQQDHKQSEIEEIIGAINLRLLQSGEFNLAYWLGEPYWGYGFCTEAGKAVLKMAYDFNLSPIIAKHLVKNAASKKVLTRLGFKYTGSEKSKHRNEIHEFSLYRL